MDANASAALDAIAAGGEGGGSDAVVQAVLPGYYFAVTRDKAFREPVLPRGFFDVLADAEFREDA